jgi:hypothetical protein
VRMMALIPNVVGFLSEGIITDRNAREKGNKQRNFTDGLLREALALKVHL